MQVEQASPFANLLGHIDVFRAGLEIAGRMVVGQDHAAAMFVDGEFENFPCVHRGTGQAAFADEHLAD